MDAQEIIKKRNEEKVVRIKDALTEEQFAPITTGLKELDKLMDGGLRYGDLLVLSGKSGHGKTTVGLNLMKQYVKLNPVLFSYEVQVNRIYDKLRKMMLGEDPNVYTPKKNISGDIDWIRERILEAVSKYKAKFIVIDHLDFITTDHKNDDGRRNEITSIMTRLKQVAVEKDLIIVLQVHVRKGERESSALGNNDLADSRSIANLADYVLFVNRTMDNEFNVAYSNTGNLVLTKNRYNGEQGVIGFTMTAADLIKEEDKPISSKNENNNLWN